MSKSIIVVLNSIAFARVLLKMNSKKTYFSAEDKQKLIDFVKFHEILYNVKHKDFRNTGKKNRLWLKLSTDLGTDGSYCCGILL